MENQISNLFGCIGILIFLTAFWFFVYLLAVVLLVD